MVNTTNGNFRPPSSGADDQSYDQLELKAKNVESALHPLINQLSSLSIQQQQSSSSKKKGKSKRAHVLVESVVEAIENFIRQGADIAQENPDCSDELMQAIGEVRATGNTMAESSRDFANDPLSSPKRAVMVQASRDLLNAVTNLLSIADMIDLNALIRSVQAVQQDLNNIKNSSNQDELMHHFKSYGVNVVELTNQAARRQADLKDTKLKDELASARATLKKSSLKLLTSAKVKIIQFNFFSFLIYI